MSLWLNEVFFQRMLCLILLLVTLIFTLILANVFVDIDGLINKNKATTESQPLVKIDDQKRVAINYDEVKVKLPFIETGMKFQFEDSLRTKRSLDPQKQIKNKLNKKIRKAFSNQLALLLRELDVEKLTTEEIKLNDIEKSTESSERMTFLKNEEQYKHLTLHNVLLKGIIGHMDMNLIYWKIRDLYENFTPYSVNTRKTIINNESKEKRKEIPNDAQEEEKIIEEIVNCKSLQNDVEKSESKRKEKLLNKKVPQMLIKTIIDISANPTNTGAVKNHTNQNKMNDNIRGIINLLYNGRPITFNQEPHDISPNYKSTVATTPQTTPQETTTSDTVSYYRRFNYDTTRATQEIAKEKNNDIVNLLLKEYMSQFRNGMNTEQYQMASISETVNSEQNQQRLEERRLKRNAKRIDNNEPKLKWITRNVRSNANKKRLNKNNGDLYVAIETFYDDKGQIGTKKKKLIKNLLEKIEDAIHPSNQTLSKLHHKNQTKDLVQIKKRLQDPINQNKEKRNRHYHLKKEMQVTSDIILHRNINPLNKAVPSNHPIPEVYDNFGNSWKHKYKGPGLFNGRKAINSAERSEVDIDYRKLGKHGIPERLQEPISTQLKDAFDVDVGDLKFIVKDIDGTGFAIGFSHYVDDVPDPNHIKLFTNVEDLIKTYHRSYDDDYSSDTTTLEKNLKPKAEHNITKRDVNPHLSVQKHQSDYRNAYQMILKRKPFDNYLFDNYQQIYDGGKPIHETSSGLDFFKNIRSKLSILNNLIMHRKLMKPAEILNLSYLINSNRKKRYVNLKKVSQVKPKSQVNKYINVKKAASKIIFKHRNKRDTNKIRVIARDDINFPKDSNEDIILVSDEHVYADRAIVKDSQPIRREMNTPEDIDYIPMPYYDSRFHSDRLLRNFFDSVRKTHNRLLSNYPHILVDDMSKSKEITEKRQGPTEIANESEMLMDPISNAESLNPRNDMFNLLPSQKILNSGGNPNYKLTVKILPRNQTEDNSGFREVRTSINKSYNKDGLAYITITNISEISKVEKVDNKTNKDLSKKSSDNHKKTKQDKMKQYLKQQKDKIDCQLHKLEEERKKLEKIMESTTTSTTTTTTVKTNNQLTAQDLLKLLLPPETSKLLNIDKDVLTNLIAASHKKNEQVNNITPKQEIIIPTIKTTITTTEATTQKTTPRIRDEVLLRTIDKNTQVLEQILKTITEKNKENIFAKRVEFNTERVQRKVNKMPKFEADSYTIPQIPRNESTAIIQPYIFTYQQPLQQNNPIASILYHGMLYNANKKINEGKMPMKEILQILPKPFDGNAFNNMGADIGRITPNVNITENFKSFLDNMKQNPPNLKVFDQSLSKRNNYNKYTAPIGLLPKISNP